MSKIVRPAKARGNQDYAKEVAAGKPDIVDVEVDLDFNTLYIGINDLDDANISGSPTKIAYSKLNLSGSIAQTDLAPGIQIPGGSIGQDTITTRELAPNAVLLENIAIQQSVAAWVPNGDDLDLPNIGATEVLCAESVWTSRGGIWVAHASIGGSIVTGGSDVATIDIYLKEGGTAGDPIAGSPTIYHHARLRYQVNGTADGLAWSAALLAAGQFGFPGPLTNPHRIKLTVKQTSTGATVTAFWKRIILVEHA